MSIQALARSIVRYELFAIYNAPQDILDKETALIIKRSGDVTDINLLRDAIEDVVERLEESINRKCLKCIEAADCFFIEDALINALSKYNVSIESIRHKLFNRLDYATGGSVCRLRDMGRKFLYPKNRKGLKKP